jgi:hypothetical protein
MLKMSLQPIETYDFEIGSDPDNFRRNLADSWRRLAEIGDELRSHSQT